MATKDYIKKYNYLLSTSLLVLFGFQFVVLFFKYSGLGAVFSVRFLLPISAALMLAALIVEFIIARPKKTALILICAAAALAAAAFIKYFFDFANYFRDNNNTQLIICAAGILAVVYYIIKNKAYKNFINGAYAGIIAACFVVALIDLGNYDILHHYIYSLMLSLSLIILLFNTQSEKACKIARICAFALAVICFIMSCIVLGTNYTLYNITNGGMMLAILAAAIYFVAAIPNRKKGIVKVIVMCFMLAFLLVLIYKYTYTDKFMLSKFNLTRELFLAAVAAHGISAIVSFKKEWRVHLILQYAFSAAIAATVIVGTIISKSKIKNFRGAAYNHGLMITMSVIIVLVSAYLLIQFYTRQKTMLESGSAWREE